MKMQFMVQCFAGRKEHFESYSMTSSLIPIGQFPQPKPALTEEHIPSLGDLSRVFDTWGTDT